MEATRDAMGSDYWPYGFAQLRYWRSIDHVQQKSDGRVAVAVHLTVAHTGAVELDHMRLVAHAGPVVDSDGLVARLGGMCCTGQAKRCTKVSSERATAATTFTGTATRLCGLTRCR